MCLFCRFRTSFEEFDNFENPLWRIYNLFKNMYWLPIGKLLLLERLLYRIHTYSLKSHMITIQTFARCLQSNIKSNQTKKVFAMRNISLEMGFPKLF